MTRAELLEQLTAIHIGANSYPACMTDRGLAPFAAKARGLLPEILATLKPTSPLYAAVKQIQAMNLYDWIPMMFEFDELMPEIIRELEGGE